MGRYRPPMKRSTRIITPEGDQRLRKELQYLWRVKRPEITSAVRDAAALGDRSENAEYIYGKKQLREIDRRVRYLQKRLDEVQVVTSIPDDSSRVFFGAWVELESESGLRAKYRIVGADEIDLESGLISIDSPMARALLGKAEGDEVEVKAPAGLCSYEIVSVRYENAEI